MSSAIWDEIWKRLQSPLSVDWYMEEFLSYLIRWSSKRRCVFFLEAGAGSGRLSYHLSQSGHEVVALDFSRNSIAMLRKLKDMTIDGALHIIQADVLHLPFRNSAFDIVFNEGVLEHFREPYSVFHEMVRVTRSLGIVTLSVPNLYSFHTLGKLILSGSISISKPYGFESSFSKSELKHMLQLFRLKDIEVHGIGLFYGVARYTPLPIYDMLYFVYSKLKSTKLGKFWTEFAGFQIVGKGEKA